MPELSGNYHFPHPGDLTETTMISLIAISDLEHLRMKNLNYIIFLISMNTAQIHLITY